MIGGTRSSLQRESNAIKTMEKYMRMRKERRAAAVTIRREVPMTPTLNMEAEEVWDEL